MRKRNTKYVKLDNCQVPWTSNVFRRLRNTAARSIDVLRAPVQFDRPAWLGQPAHSEAAAFASPLFPPPTSPYCNATSSPPFRRGTPPSRPCSGQRASRSRHPQLCLWQPRLLDVWLAQTLLQTPSGVFVQRQTCLAYIDNNRQDVDIILLDRDPNWDSSKSLTRNVERIKRELVDTYSNHEGAPFYLEKPKADPKKRKTYMKLFYRLDDDFSYDVRSCKVDLVFHTTRAIGIRNLLDDVESQPNCGKSNPHGVPVAPLLTLLALKLKGWDLRRFTHRRDQLKKRKTTDQHDIKELLNLAVQAFRLKGRTEQSWSQTFRKGLKKRVGLFADDYPETRQKWAELGFDV
jgi:hypothetical protein